MSFTTIDAVAARYPGFQRGVANQSPSDAQIQAWIDNHAARLTALAAARGYDLTSLETSNPRACSLLALINDVGASADLGDALYSLLGPEASPQGWANPNFLRKSFADMLAELARGDYDKLFIPDARTGDAYPAFGGTAGQETDPEDSESDVNVAFRKNDDY